MDHIDMNHIIWTITYGPYRIHTVWSILYAPYPVWYPISFLFLSLGTRLVECGWTWCFCFCFNFLCHPCDIFVTWKIARKVHLPEVSFLLIAGILLYAYGLVGTRSIFFYKHHIMDHIIYIRYREKCRIFLYHDVYKGNICWQNISHLERCLGKNNLIVIRCITRLFFLPPRKCFWNCWFQIKWRSDHAWCLSNVVLGIQYVSWCTHRCIYLLRNSTSKLLHESCHAQTRRIRKSISHAT